MVVWELYVRAVPGVAPPGFREVWLLPPEDFPFDPRLKPRNGRGIRWTNVASR
jgi:hypothetical protein